MAFEAITVATITSLNSQLNDDASNERFTHRFALLVGRLGGIVEGRIVIASMLFRLSVNRSRSECNCKHGLIQPSQHHGPLEHESTARSE